MSTENYAYFDNNATTPIDPRVVEAMLPWLGGQHGNPSSAHAPGRAARAAVDAARAQVAELIGAAPEDVMFLSSGSEANNTVIETAVIETAVFEATVFEAAAKDASETPHLIVTALEHPSVRAAATRAQEIGAAEVTELRPGVDGRVSADAVRKALRPSTRLVSLMLANNELGTIQPVADVARVVREHGSKNYGATTLTDAVQAVGKIPVDVEALGVDYLCLGGHKFHGPPGVGALWVRPGAPLRPLLVGAPQERGRRASTENVPAIVGLGAAAELARRELDERHRHLASLRDRFETSIVERLPDARIHCADSPRLPHTSHIAFPGFIGYDLAQSLDALGFAVSIGAACHSGKPQPSRVVLALGVDPAEALASLRVSFGMMNTIDEVDRFVEALSRVVPEMREKVGSSNQR